ncbi:MAG: hemolysin family protein, partial [Desulfocurvibacter africanus]
TGLDDNQSDSIWAHIKNLFRGKDDEMPLEKAILEAKEEGDLAAEDTTMLLNVLRLSRLSVHEIMIPRTDMVCAEVTDSIQQLGQLIVEHGHSRIPIYEDDKDNIVGLIYTKDLLPAMLGSSKAELTIRDILRPAMFVPENKNARDMLREFLARRMHMAIALDEYGGTSGLVTLEDVIEQIVGDIEDEHDIQEPEEILFLDNGQLRVSGRMALEDLNEESGMRLSSDQVETIGGYLCELTGRVPRSGDSFVVQGRKITVAEADKKQVKWITISAPEALPAGGTDSQ